MDDDTPAAAIEECLRTALRNLPWRLKRDQAEQDLVMGIAARRIREALEGAGYEIRRRPGKPPSWPSTP